MHEMINKYRSVVVVLAIIILVIAVVRMMPGTANQPVKQWYYDVSENKLFAATAVDNPIQSPAGNPAYFANVYSCSACNEEQRFVAYMERPGTSSSETASASNDPTIPDYASEGMAPLPEIALPPEAGQEVRWFSTSSMEAATIMNVARRCQGSTLQKCKPE